MPVASSAILKRNIYFPKRKISKILIVYYLLSQAVGLDFGFASAIKRKYRLCVQRSTRLLSILIFVIMLTYLTFLYDDIWCWINAVKCNGFVLVLITTRYKLYHLIYDINGICDLTTKHVKILNIITILYTLIMYMIKISLGTIRCIWESESYCTKFESTFYLGVYIGISLSLDVTVVTQIIITYYFKCGVRLLQVYLKKPKRKLNVYEKSYMAIADCYDKIRPFFNWLIILKVGITVPELMVSIWSCMLYIKGNAQWFSYVTEIVVSVHLTMQICIPAIIVELLNSEIDATIQILNQELMEEKDGKEIEDLKRILHYITKRPLRHLVWRFIPIDLRLLLTLFSVCTSYFIVVLQFSQII